MAFSMANGKPSSVTAETKVPPQRSRSAQGAPRHKPTRAVFQRGVSAARGAHAKVHIGLRGTARKCTIPAAAAIGLSNDISPNR